MKQIQLAAKSAEILMCLTQRSLELHLLSELVRKAIPTDAQKASRPLVYFSVYWSIYLANLNKQLRE
jgi:hypothetical protein